MSDLKFTYKNEALDNDAEVTIPDVGIIKNGGSLTVSDEDQDKYKQIHGHDLKDALEANGAITVSGTGKKGGES